MLELLFTIPCALVLLTLNMMCNTAYMVDGDWISMVKLTCMQKISMS